MSNKILCAIYLLIAISAVHSASFYYRAGREVIVPAVEEVREVVAELKKDEPVVVKEDEAYPVLTNDDIEKLIASRSVQHPVLRLDSLEVVQPGKSDKVVTVAETVKNAAVQAIEKQNQEVAESVKAEAVEPVVETKVEVTKVDDVPAVKSGPIIEPVEIKSGPIIEPVEIKSQAVESPEAIVPIVKEEIKVESAAPAIEAVKELNEVQQVAEVKEEVKPVQESVRSADPEAVKPEEPIKQEVVEVPQPTVVDEPKPAIRQQPPAAAPSVPPLSLQGIQSAISNIAGGFATIFGLQNANNANQKPQSDTETTLNSNEVAAPPAVVASATPTTAAPNLIQQAITQISQQVSQLNQNFFNRPTTAAPAVAAPPVVSGTRGSDEETVEVVQNIEVDVNDKVDLAKKTQ